MGVDGFRHGSAARGPARLTVLTSFRERALSAASQAGMVNNLNDGLAWPGASFRSCSAGTDQRIGQIGILAARVGVLSAE